MTRFHNIIRGIRPSMTTPEHIFLLEKVTRRLAQAFQEVHQLCLDEIQRMKPPQQIEEQEVEDIPEPIANPVENETPEEAEKETKTKKIRKQAEQKTGDDKGKKKGKAISHKPKAPASSFLLFFKQHQASISKTYPTYGVTELTKVAAKCWKELSNEEKEPFIKQCDQERKLYQQKMEKYRVDFPQEIAEKARKTTKKQRKSSPSTTTPKKEKESPVEENNEAAANVPLVAEDVSQSQNNQEEMDSLGVV